MLTATNRRTAILQHLLGSTVPVSATTLAQLFGVSRQIIVGDIAILRASGEGISATPRGYMMDSQPTGITQKVACIHDQQGMEAELNAIVDAGGEVVDVIVEHAVYGQLTGILHIRSRYDVQDFLQKSAAQDAKPLSDLTGGVHLHTIRCPNQAVLDRVLEALSQGEFLYIV